MEKLADVQKHNLLSLSQACGVTIPTFDAWMPADEQALNRALRSSVQQQRAPKEIRDPKDQCARLLETSEIKMSQSELYSAVICEVDIDAMKVQCPKGFSPLAEQVRALFKQHQRWGKRWRTIRRKSGHSHEHG